MKNERKRRLRNRSAAWDRLVQSASRIEALEGLPRLVEGSGHRQPEAMLGHVQFTGIRFACVPVPITDGRQAMRRITIRSHVD